MPCLRVLTLLAVLSLPVAGSNAANYLSQPAPDFALKNLAGENLRLSEYRGDVVLVNFWASWCGRCREQLQPLDRIHAEFAERGLQVISVNIDDDTDKARAASSGLNFPILLDDRKRVARLYDPGRMPLTLLIDPYGNVRFVHEGYRGGDEDRYRAELEELLAE